MRISLLFIALGILLMATSLTFGAACSLIGISDLVSGLLLIVLGTLSIAPTRGWSGWAAGAVGVWLQFAPLVFWAKEPAIYLMDTLVGLLVIILSFCLQKNDADALEICPGGWTYNPSGWGHRIPTVALAMLCWFFSRYMAAYQLGYLSHIWDPFFKEGTLHVITSQISKDFPVSDAGLGALFYSLESVLGWQGSARRWKTMPWLVFAFGFMVIPVGIVSITLIILQPVVVGAWCSWCLGTAVCMLVMILLTAGELAAVLQLLYEVRKKGGSLWSALWQPDASQNFTLLQQNKKKGMGISFPWTLLLSIAIGIWLMSSPSVFHITGKPAMGNYIFGPLIAAFSFIACAEVFRAVRYLNVFFGALLLMSPWVLGEQLLFPTINTLFCGASVIAAAFHKGKISQNYGLWNKMIF